MSETPKTRREFFRKTFGAAMLAPLLPWELAKKIVSGGVSVGALPKGHTVIDILIGFEGIACDLTWMVEFYRRSDPARIVMPVVLNQRATFRWAAAPGQDIYLAPGDRLEWRTKTYPESGYGSAATARISTQGHDQATGRLMIDQSWYAPEMPAEESSSA